MSINFEKNTFKKRIKSMLGVDIRRMFTSPLFFIMVGISLIMPILILVMTTMMDGMVTTDPQTGAQYEELKRQREERRKRRKEKDFEM